MMLDKFCWTTPPPPRGFANLCEKKGLTVGASGICIKIKDFRAHYQPGACGFNWRMLLNLNPQAQKAGLSYRALRTTRE